MSEKLQITAQKGSGFQIVLDGHVIPDVVAYTLQEGCFSTLNEASPKTYTRKLTLEILLGPNRDLEVQR